MTAGTLPELLAARLVADGASPLVTFYDDATGERTELSAATFANWVAKTANLVTDGLGLGPGDRAALTLPLHWQTLVVAAGCWAAGLEVVTDRTADEAADVALAAEGGPASAADEVVRLSLRPMGAGLTVADPAAVDFAAEVRGYGDRFGGAGPTADSPALDGRSHATLLTSTADPRRLLLANDDLVTPAVLLTAYVGPLLGGGSVVLCRHADAAALPRRAEVERAELLAP